MTFLSNYLQEVTFFLHVPHLDVLRRQIEINFLMYGYNAGPPMAIPITQYGSTVYIGMAMGGSAL